MSDLLVHLIRHGQAYNTHRAEGEPNPSNPPLTPVGVLQAEQLARRFAAVPIDRLLSSPMRRTVETASILAEACGTPVEIRHGSHEFRRQPGYLAWGADALRERYPHLRLPIEFAAADWYYGEEALDTACARADRLLATLRREAGPGHHRIALVTHGAFTRIVLARALDVDPLAFDRRVILDHTSVTTLRISGDQISVLAINDTTHLAGGEWDPLGGVTRTYTPTTPTATASHPRESSPR